MLGNILMENLKSKILIIAATRWCHKVLPFFSTLTYIREYLNRINLYRQRVWVCKVTGKTSLTYEEALVSEKRAGEKVQQFPKELMAPVLRIIQYSMYLLTTVMIKILLLSFFLLLSF